MRIAAGLERPDEGMVCVQGSDLAKREDLLGGLVTYCDPRALTRDAHRFGAAREQVIGTLMVAQLGRGVPTNDARRGVLGALERAGAEHCQRLRLEELDCAEAVRVAIAHALACEPALLLIDEPTSGVDLLERDPILRLLRSLADEGLAILTCVGETTGLFGVNRALWLDAGELRGKVSPELAPVVALGRQLSA